MAVNLWHNLSGLVRGQKESSYEGRLGTQTWRFGSEQVNRQTRSEPIISTLKRRFYLYDAEQLLPRVLRDDGRREIHVRDDKDRNNAAIRDLDLDALRLETEAQGARKGRLRPRRQGIPRQDRVRRRDQA